MPRSPRGQICTKFATTVGVTSNKFFGDRSTGVDSVGVKNCPLSLTKPVEVNTVTAQPVMMEDADFIIVIIIYVLKSTEQEDAHIINTRTKAGQERHRKLALTFCP